MQKNTVDRATASVGSWKALRALEAEIQDGLAQDGIGLIDDAFVVRPPTSAQAFHAARRFKPFVSGMALLGLGFMAWLAGPESSPWAAARASAVTASAPPFVDPGAGRAPARPFALRPGLTD